LTDGHSLILSTRGQPIIQLYMEEYHETAFLLLCRIHFPWLFQTKWI